VPPRWVTVTVVVWLAVGVALLVYMALTMH
jgi:hypothetical protein